MTATGTAFAGTVTLVDNGNGTKALVFGLDEVAGDCESVDRGIQATSQPGTPSGGGSTGTTTGTASPTATTTPVGAADVTPPLFRLAKRSVRLGAGRTIPVAIACGEATEPCHGTLTLTTASGRVLGTVAISVPAGKKSSYTIRLTPKGRRALGRGRSAQVRLKATLADAAGNAITRSSTFTVRLR